MAFENNYYAIVEERDSGRAAFELLANDATGVVAPEPGPNMMWNTEYGHMRGPFNWPGGMGGGAWASFPNAGGRVEPGEAQRLAQAWLNTRLPGRTASSPRAFPGYYTLHVEQDQATSGMLSVNAATGQVWYHTWHGAFLGQLEAEH